MRNSINQGFWKGKKVLITGYEGFLGSNLTKKLLNLDANIFGLDIKTRRKTTILTKQDFKKIHIVKGSVENFKLVKNIISQNKIEVIFHLAAKAIVGECLENPLGGFTTNIQGTWNVLEAACNNKFVKAVVVASSDKAYGNHKELPYKEGTSLIGNYPYDVSKSCADLISYTYNHTYGVPVAVTRCGNIFGPGDFNFSRIVPDIIRSALRGQTLLIRSDGKYTRDYVYVDDVVNGYIILAERLKKLKLGGEAFNFSNEKPISVVALVKEIYRLAQEKQDYKILKIARYEIRNQYLCSLKARKKLKWRPYHDLEKGLIETIKWYKQTIKK